MRACMSSGTSMRGWGSSTRTSLSSSRTLSLTCQPSCRHEAASSVPQREPEGGTHTGGHHVINHVALIISSALIFDWVAGLSE